MNIPRKSAIKLGSVGIAILLITALLVILIPARVDVTGEGRLSITFDYKVYASPDTATNSPSATAGVWTTPEGAYAPGEPYAYVTSSKKAPIPAQTYSGYGFDIPSDIINSVVVNYEAWTDGDEQIRVDVSWDAGSNWSTQQATSLTASEAPYSYNVTGATSWTSNKLHNDNFRVRVDAFTVGGDSVVYLDWIPVDVDYSANITIPPPTSVDFGTVSASTGYWSLGANTTAPSWPLADAECYFSVSNNSTAAVDITIKAIDFTGDGGWTLAATPGVNQVTLKAGKSEDANEDEMVTLAVADQDYAFITALDASLSKKWELKMETPTEFGDGTEKTSTITLTATFSS